MKASIYQKYPKRTILLTLASHADLALSHPSMQAGAQTEGERESQWYE